MDEIVDIGFHAANEVSVKAGGVDADAIGFQWGVHFEIPIIPEPFGIDGWCG